MYKRQAIPPSGILNDEIFICSGCIENYYMCNNSIIDFIEKYKTINQNYINELHECIKHFLPQLFKLSRKQIPQSIRDKVLKKYGYECIKCGSKENLEIDHIKAYSNGGDNKECNLQVLCKKCNLRKGVK